jgi:nucleoside-diphosphate-sugar epimerase
MVSLNRVGEIIGGLAIHLPARSGEARHSLADFSEASRILGWYPQVATEDGLRELLGQASSQQQSV